MASQHQLSNDRGRRSATNPCQNRWIPAQSHVRKTPTGLLTAFWQIRPAAGLCPQHTHRRFWRQDVHFCLEENQEARGGLLTDWEVDFLTSLLNFKALSPQAARPPVPLKMKVMAP